MLEVHRESGGFTPPAQLNVFDFLFNRGGIPGAIPLGPTPCNVYPVKSERYFTGACPACPVGQNDRTGVNSFSVCLLAKSDRIGGDRLDLVNRGHACPSTGVRPFLKKVSHKAPLTHNEGGAFLFCLPHEAGP